MTRKRSVHLLGACVLLGGGIAMPVLLGAVGAQAAPCGTATAAGQACPVAGSAVIDAGVLSLTPPAGLTWGGGVTGVDQTLVDTTAGDETYAVNDATGSGSGWAVTITATTFTNLASLATTQPALPDTGTLETGGDTTTGGEASADIPTAACVTGTTCTLPTNTIGFPVPITTAPSGGTLPPSTIYNAEAPTAVGVLPAVASSGLGSIVIGGVGTDIAPLNPVAWWLNVPANTLAGTYSSTITLAVVSGP
jgi:hypothetical protein